MKPREFMTFGALFYLVLSDVYGLFRQRVILTGVRKYSHTFEELFSLQWEFFLIGMRMFEKIYNKKGNLIMKFPFLFRIEKFGLLVSSFFFDSSFLTSKSAQVVQFSATNFTYLVHFDAIDSRWFDWENSFYAYSSWHFTYSKTFLVSVTGDFDNNTTVQLYTFFVTLDDTICYCYSVSCL